MTAYVNNFIMSAPMPSKKQKTTPHDERNGYNCGLALRTMYKHPKHQHPKANDTHKHTLATALARGRGTDSTYEDPSAKKQRLENNNPSNTHLQIQQETTHETTNTDHPQTQQNPDTQQQHAHKYQKTGHSTYTKI